MTKAAKGGRGGQANADEGGEGVKQSLTIADEGGRGGLKTPEIGWRNMWTAPYYVVFFLEIPLHCLFVWVGYVKSSQQSQ